MKFVVSKLVGGKWQTTTFVDSAATYSMSGESVFRRIRMYNGLTVVPTTYRLRITSYSKSGAQGAAGATHVRQLGVKAR